MSARKEAQLRAWLREAIAEKHEATEAREGLAFDNLKLARRVAELNSRLEEAERNMGTTGLSSLLSWGDPLPHEDLTGQELKATLHDNESLQAALIDVQRSHGSTLRLQEVQQRVEVNALVAEIEGAELDVNLAMQKAIAATLEDAESQQQVSQCCTWMSHMDVEAVCCLFW